MREDVIGKIDPEHREEFRRFIETGEASGDFLAYMDESEECQHAIEQVFAQEAAHFEELARSLALSEAREGSVRSLSPPAVVPLRRRWNWRGAYPYAMAASLVLALLAGFLTWNVASVARHEESRATLLEKQYSGVLLDRYASQQRLVILQQQLAEVQGKIAEVDSLGTQNRQYRSEVSRLRKQKSELEKALAKERSRIKEIEQLAEKKNQPEEGKPPSSTAKLPLDESMPRLPVDGAEVDSAEAEAVEDRIVVEGPKLVSLRLPAGYTTKIPEKGIPVQILVSKAGNATKIQLQFSKKVSPRVRFGFELAFRDATYRPGTRNGEPAEMWLNDLVLTPEGVRVGLKAPDRITPQSPPG